MYAGQDDILWKKIEQSLCSLDNDLFVGLCYVVLDGSIRQSMVETNVFDRFLDSLLKISRWVTSIYC